MAHQGQGLTGTVNWLRKLEKEKKEKKALVDALGALQEYNTIDALGALQEYKDDEVSSVHVEPVHVEQSVQGWKKYFKGMMSKGKVKAAVLLSVLIPTVVKIMGLYSALPHEQQQQALGATKLLFNNQTMAPRISSLFPIWDKIDNDNKIGKLPWFKSKKSPKKSKKSPKKSVKKSLKAKKSVKKH
jgi:hypothetical protein